MISDCCSLVQHVEFNSVVSATKVQEERLTLDLTAIKNGPDSKECIEEIVWTATGEQLAD